MLVSLQVHPRASRNQLVREGPDRLTLRLTAPPVEGAANEACCAFLAGLLGIAKSRLTILRGTAGRRKQIRIRDANLAEVLSRLPAE